MLTIIETYRFADGPQKGEERKIHFIHPVKDPVLKVYQIKKDGYQVQKYKVDRNTNQLVFMSDSFIKK